MNLRAKSSEDEFESGVDRPFQVGLHRKGQPRQGDSHASPRDRPSATLEETPPGSGEIEMIVRVKG